MAALVHDLGRPERFLNMLRVVKLTSPMSVGTWILSGYSACAGVTTATRKARLSSGSRVAIAPTEGFSIEAGDEAAVRRVLFDRVVH